MVEHKCPKCGKIFNKKSSFNNHLKKLKPCKKDKKNQYECKHCNKLFTRKYNLNRHIKTAHNINVDTTNIENNNGNIIIGDHNNLTVNNNQFFLLPFGTYCLEKDLSVEDKVKIFSSKSGAIETIILKTHLNPELPQYHNCGITDLHVSYGIIYDGDNWIYKPISNIMHDLIENGQKESIELYKQIKNFLQDDVRKEIKNDLEDDKYLLYPRTDKKDKNAKKDLIKYLKPTFYNKRELVNNSIKNSGKKIIDTTNRDPDNAYNILREGVTFQDIEEHIQKYIKNKEKIPVKKELAMHILDQFDNINHSKYCELEEKLNKTNDIETIDIITELLIGSFCGMLDINKLIINDEIHKKINKQMEMNKFI